MANESNKPTIDQHLGRERSSSPLAPVSQQPTSANSVEQIRAPLVILKVVAGTDRGKRFSYTEHGIFSVGRSKETSLRIPKDDPLVSRFHFLIEINPPNCRLLDLDSRNGTFVNKTRVSQIDLRSGDLIQAGRTAFQIKIRAPETERSSNRPTKSLPVNQADSATVDYPAVRSHTAAIPAVALEVRVPDVAGTQTDEEHPALPGFKFLRRLGTGGMGTVFLVERLATKTQLAMKMIKPAVEVRPLELQMFLREAKILKQLQHPSIVAFDEMHEFDGCLYFTMEFIPGVDAEKLIREQGPLPVDRALAIIGDLLQALSYAHSRGFVHRDVKPSNLLVASSNGREHGYLADFGLARVYEQSHLSGLTLLGDLRGTIPFIPPEQILRCRDAVPASDQYAAAATLYSLLTGQLLHQFGRLSIEKQLLKILMEEPTPIQTYRPELSDPLARTIHRALSTKVTDRFASVADFQQALMSTVNV